MWWETLFDWGSRRRQLELHVVLITLKRHRRILGRFRFLSVASDGDEIGQPDVGINRTSFRRRKPIVCRPVAGRAAAVAAGDGSSGETVRFRLR